MDKVNKKTKKTKKIKINYFKIFTILLFIYCIYTLYIQQINISKYNSEIEVYKSDITNKEKLVEYYNSQKVNASSDEFIESIAREQLGYVKPYEKIFVDVNK